MQFFSIARVFLYLAPFAMLVVTPSTLFPFIVGKYTYFKIMVEFALIFTLLGWGFDPRAFHGISFRGFVGRPLVVAVSLFMLIFLLSGLLGINPHASFWSSFERGEGVFLLLHCYAFFLLLALLFRKAEDWRRYFYVALVAGLFVIVYGVFAALGAPGFLGKDFCTRFAGSLGNPSYLGTLSIFMVFYSGYLLVTGLFAEKAWRARTLPLLALSLCIFLVFLLLSQTRGALLGLGVGIISALIYLFVSLPVRRERTGALVLVLALVLLGFFGIYFRGSINLLPFCGTESGGGNRILDVSLQTESYQTRWILWGQSLSAFKERPILGWGVENFSAAFEKYFDIRHKVWFDRAHNIFFDYLVFSGIFGLLSFLSIFVAFFWQFMRLAHVNDPYPRRTEKNMLYAFLVSNQPYLERALFFALPIAYLVQGSVLFDVLPIYINLFIFLAFASFKFESWRIVKK